MRDAPAILLDTLAYVALWLIAWLLALTGRISSDESSMNLLFSFIQLSNHFAPMLSLPSWSARSFREAVSFTDNEGTMSGGAFAVLGEGSLTFSKPDLMTTSGNTVRIRFVPGGSLHATVTYYTGSVSVEVCSRTATMQ